VRNALDVWLASRHEDRTPRIGRRTALIAAAVEPLEGLVAPERLELLRHALALTIGTEAVIAARDVCGLDPSETRELTAWATGALVRAALDSR
jgi:hypothetical protein